MYTYATSKNFRLTLSGIVSHYFRNEGKSHNGRVKRFIIFLISLINKRHHPTMDLVEEAPLPKYELAVAWYELILNREKLYQHLKKLQDDISGKIL